MTARVPRLRRQLAVAGIAIGATWLLSGCHGGPHAFTVNTFTDGPDANPGDDICEMTPATGDCSLRAAIDEANASSGTPIDISLPTGTYVLTEVGVDDTNQVGDLDLLNPGEVRLTADLPGAVIDAGVNPSALDVHIGTGLVRNIAVTGANAAAVSVHGGATFAGDSVSIYWNWGPGIDAQAGSAVNLIHTTLSSNDIGIANQGTLQAGYVTISRNNTGGITGAGTSALWMTVVADQSGGADCTAPVTSNDYNLDSDGTCGLDQANDVSGVPATLAALSPDLLRHHQPMAGSPAIEAIPVSAGLCGSGLAGWDQMQVTRPISAKCDRGAVEATSLELVVTHGGDDVDALPGDGACQDTSGLPGDCSLRAAIQETNAFTGAGTDEITLPGPFDTITLTRVGAGEDLGATGDLDVTADLIVWAMGTRIDANGLDGVLDVHGGTLQLDQVGLTGAAGDGLTVRSGATATLSQSSSTGHGGSGARVHPGSSLTASATTFSSNGGAGLTNDGTSLLQYATVTNNSAGGIGGAAGATLLTTVVSDQVLGSDCVVAVTSNDYNHDSDGSCGLAQPGDTSGTPARLGSLTSDLLPYHVPEAGSPLLQRMAVGAGSCGIGPLGSLDQRNGLRPVSGLCDVGAIEATSLSITVNHSGDDVDSAPGNGTCQDAGGLQGDCSLRAAILEANAFTGSPDQIAILPALPPIVLSPPAGADEDAGDLDIGDEVVIIGNDSVVDGNSTDRVIEATYFPGTVQLSGLTVRNGVVTGDGGGILSDGPQLELTDVTVEDSQASGDGGGIRAGQLTLTNATVEDNTAGAAGGGVWADGIVHMTDSTVRANGATDGGGLWVGSGQGDAFIDGSTVSANTATDGGGLYIDTTDLTFSNTTVSTNTATDEGGAFYIEGDIDIDFATIWANTAPNGAGIYHDRGNVRTTATLLDNPGWNCLFRTGPFANNNFTSGGFNLDTDATCDLQGSGELIGLNPVLAPLADNGGPTETHLPYLGSATTDAIPTSAPPCQSITNDQRGVARPAGSGCDVGAVEGAAGATLPSLTHVVDNAADVPDASPGDGVCDIGDGSCTLRAAVDEANTRVSTDTIEISPGINPVLTIAGAGEDLNAAGDLDLRSFVIIDGNGMTLDAAGLDRALDAATSPLTVIDLTITGGAGPGGAGGGVRLLGPATFDNSTVVGNDAGTSDGGGIYAQGPLTVVDSVITGNTTSGSGGGVFAIHPLQSTDTDFLANVATGLSAGGAISGLRDLTITGGTVDGNSAGANSDEGGALHHEGGVLDLSGVTLTANAGTAVFVSQLSSAATLSGVTIDGSIDMAIETRVATTIDRSAFTGSGGDGIRSSALLTITDSTISGNAGLGLSHGGTPSEPATLTNVTVSGNQDSGIRTGSPNLNVRMSTIVDNGLTTGVGIDNALGFVTAVGVAFDNPRGNCTNSVVSFGYNLDDDGSCGLANPNDLATAPALVAPLAANGGPTETHLPYGSSPLVDAVPIGTGLLCDGVVPTDQRGTARPQGASCDVGAVEGDNGLNPTPLVLTVDVATDAVDATPGDGLCDDGAGNCTLRAAVMEANTWPTDDTIELQPGVSPVLSIPGVDEDFAATGDLDLRSDLTIDGKGETVDGGSMDRVFHALLGADLAITDLTITNGSADDGGGLLQDGEGTDVVITDTVFLSNSAVGQGGGLFLDDPTGSFTPTNVDFTSNTAGTGGGASIVSTPVTFPSGSFTQNQAVDGGGLYLASSTVSFDSVTISDNDATNRGGGLYQGGANVTITNSTLDLNTAETGGAAWHSGDWLTISDTSLDNNVAEEGGAIYSDDPLTLLRVTFGGNQATSTTGAAYGGALRAWDTTVITSSSFTGNIASSTVNTAYGGAIYISQATLDMDRTTISGNTATSVTQTARGGGIATYDVDADIDRSTISGNTAASAAVPPWGGGIFHEASLGAGEVMRLTRSTVSGNAANGTFLSRGGGISTRLAIIERSTITLNTAANGRGIHVDSSPQVQVSGSIVDGGGAKSCIGSITSLGYNLSSDATCSFTGPGDIENTDPQLGGLADNGGATWTHLPALGAPGEDSIPDPTAGICGMPPTQRDQRWLPRPYNGSCDIGSVERQAGDP